MEAASDLINSSQLNTILISLVGGFMGLSVLVGGWLINRLTLSIDSMRSEIHSLRIDLTKTDTEVEGLKEGTKRNRR